VVRLDFGIPSKNRFYVRTFYLCLSLWLMLIGGLFLSPNTGAGADSCRVTAPLWNAAIPKDDPVVPDTREALAKGKFLVASRRLNDPNFSQTVVLLIDYGPDGAMGLVINRPSNVKLSTVFPDVKELKQRRDTVYVGGPVAVNQMLMLIRSPQAPAASVPVIKNIYLSSSWEVLERLIKKATAEEQFRLFAGYAGWAPNQLDFERNRGDWHVIEADADSVFAHDPKALWPELIRRASVKWVHLEKSAAKSN
jgi:putative transcriptional regulator